MKRTPKVGTTGEQTFVVEPRHAIDFAEGGMPAVLCTPWLIWFLEHAARAAVLPLLEPGESTVGTEIQIRHLAATPYRRRDAGSQNTSAVREIEPWLDIFPYGYIIEACHVQLQHPTCSMRSPSPAGDRLSSYLGGAGP
jgi:hypothetical protein